MKHSSRFARAVTVIMLFILAGSAFLIPPVRAANTLLLQTDFEDGTAQGWVGRGAAETLAAAPEAARSGTYGLKVTGRAQSWHGPTLDVTANMTPGQTYLFSGWIKLPAGTPNTTVYMTMQRTMPDKVYYEQLYYDTAASDRWVELKAEYTLREAADQLSIYFEAPSNATTGFYLDDFRMERLPDVGPIVIEEGIPSLKDVFANDFKIGTAFSNSELATEVDRKLMIKHFGSVTPGNVLKWDSTEPQEGVFQFIESDKAVQFAVDNGQEIRGHTLIWHQQTPDWVFRDASGNLVSKAVLYQRMENHIKTVIGRYKNSVHTWDVANEVIDASQSDGLRRSLWYQIAGEEYIEKAFQFAREADPSAKLFINDYNTHESGKSQALYNLIGRLKAKGVPIDGVGHQMHIKISWPSMQEIETSIVKFADLGIDSHITELDMDIYDNSSQSYDTFPSQLAQAQASRYKQLFDIFRNHKNLISSVTFWGKDDGNTWLRSFPVIRKNWPLLFDERLQSKPAYWAVVDIPQIPAAPASLTATADNGLVDLSWTASSGAASYNVKRAATSGGPYTTIAAGVTATSYADAGLTNGTTYYYAVSAANSSGESVNSPEASATPTSSPTGNLKVEYRVGDASATDSQIKPLLRIINTGTTAVPLSQLKIRYYYTKGSTQSETYNCDYAVAGCGNLTAAFGTVAPAAAGADTYVEIGFASGAGSVSAGGNSGDIQSRINLANWSSYNEADDYSYKGTQTSYAPSAAVTLYRNGTLVWGTEPGGSTTPTAPAAPAGLTATAGNAQVALSWTASSGAASYNVKRAAANGGPYTTVAAGVEATSYADAGLTNGTTYDYVVSAVNGAGESANSAQASAKPSAPTVPAAPTGLTATAGNAQVALSWTVSSGATSYTVKRAPTSGGPFANVATGVTATSYTNTGLTNGTTYFYVVSAANSAGESANSAQVSATPSGGGGGTDTLVAQYKLNNANASDNMINATFNIKNTGTTAVNLSNVKLRYYFTKDGAAGLNFWCDYAQIGTSAVSGAFAAISPAATGADTYLEISLGSAAGSIAAGGQTGDIQVRVAKSDWTNFNEANDYSYDGTKTAYADWNKIALYENGAIAWGVTP
ncbi:endo-1,4-beta-xylanase [Cohnella suwonensis]|uniref:Beta-xylanase n=1 Tax=Cohnella suwonensis TaxID=696072 RepID=A0ABW0M0R7_9BACL